MEKLKPILAIIKETFAAWSADKASRLAAALAYYTVFSLAPLLIIIMTTVGFVYNKFVSNEADVQETVTIQLEENLGKDAAAVVQGAIDNATQPTTLTFASFIGFFTLLFAASGLFLQLQDALNTIWKAEPRWSGIMGFIKQRLLLFGTIFLVGGLMLLSLVLGIVVTAIINFFQSDTFLGLASLEIGSLNIDFEPYLGFIKYIDFLQYINIALSLAMMVLLFGLLYKILPDVTIAWRDVWIGAAVTSLLFTLGKLLISLYLGSSNVGSAYGAAGSLIVLLVWIYYSAQVFLLGAEFTHIYAHQYGSLKPTTNTVALSSTETSTSLTPEPTHPMPIDNNETSITSANTNGKSKKYTIAGAGLFATIVAGILWRVKQNIK